MTKNIRLLQAQRISDNKYLQGKEIDRNSKIHTINQLTDIIDSPQLTLLDVGCGTGINAKKLKKKGYKVYGIDISTVAIKEFQKSGFKGKQCDIIVDGVPYDDNFFDVVFASEVIEHVSDTDEFMNELYRVLKPQGKIVLSTPNSSFWVYRVYTILGKTLTEVQHPGHLRFFSKKLLHKYFLDSEFRDILIKSRKVYLALPNRIGSILNKLTMGKVFTKEFRFTTKEYVWILEKNSECANSFWSETLIVSAKK